MSWSTKMRRTEEGSRNGAVFSGERKMSILCRLRILGRENSCHAECPEKPSWINVLLVLLGDFEVKPINVSIWLPSRFRSCNPLPIPPFRSEEHTSELQSLR